MKDTMSLDEWEERLEREFPEYLKGARNLEKQKREFAINLTSYMISKGINEEELAIYCSLATETIYRMKEGRYRPQQKTLEYLAEALECKIEDLWTDY